MTAQDLTHRLGADAAAPVFPQHEKLAHVAFDVAAIAVGVGIDQGKAGRMLPDADQQRPAVRIAPIVIEIRINLEAAGGVDVEGGRTRRLQFGEVVGVELHQAFDQHPLGRAGGRHMDAAHRPARRRRRLWLGAAPTRERLARRIRAPSSSYRKGTKT